MAKKKSKKKLSKISKTKTKSDPDLGDLAKLFQKKNSQWIDNMSEANVYVFAQYGGGSCTENSYTPSACCPSIGSCRIARFCR